MPENGRRDLIRRVKLNYTWEHFTERWRSATERRRSATERRREVQCESDLTQTKRGTSGDWQLSTPELRDSSWFGALHGSYHLLQRRLYNIRRLAAGSAESPPHVATQLRGEPNQTAPSSTPKSGKTHGPTNYGLLICRTLGGGRTALLNRPRHWQCIRHSYMEDDAVPSTKATWLLLCTIWTLKKWGNVFSFLSRFKSWITPPRKPQNPHSINSTISIKDKTASV